MTSNDIARRIKQEYDFNGYEIERDKILEIVRIITELYEKKWYVFDSFIKELHCGKLGMWYKQPVSFLYLAQKYFFEKKDMPDPNKKVFVGTKYLYKEGWKDERE